ncbi:MAG: SDR family NAD(P)-dependent oxidoreductase [Oceanococcus sp.]
MIIDPEYHKKYGPWAVVAGASEGIGQSFAHALAEKGFNLLMLARRIEPLNREAELLRRRYHVEVRTVSMDLSATDLEQQYNDVSADMDIGLLVYNACYSVIGEFKSIALGDHQKMLDVNCRGPVILSHCMIDRLLKRGSGGIILMSSMSGFQGTAMVANYAATKAWNINFTQGLWSELTPHGIDVLGCIAGATSTPGFEGNTPKDKRGKAFPMHPDDVAREGLAALGKRPLHITGAINRSVDRLGHFMSRKARTNFISKATRDIYDNA